jgi:biopolymer transport protein ExbD
MADIQPKESNSNKRGGKRMKKKSTAVDLTPMVDLGFILLTFFIFTSTMAEPTVMNIVVPKETKEAPSEICESCALTVLLHDKDKLMYYLGDSDTATYHPTTFSAEGIRTLLTEKKKQVQALRGADQLQLIIKPSDQSTLGSLIDIIDENNIALIARYYIDDLNERDKEKIINY